MKLLKGIAANRLPCWYDQLDKSPINHGRRIAGAVEISRSRSLDGLCRSD
jgi:hypothetical protein